jgi:hypothetical protein
VATLKHGVYGQSWVKIATGAIRNTRAGASCFRALATSDPVVVAVERAAQPLRSTSPFSLFFDPGGRPRRLGNSFIHAGGRPRRFP